MSEEIAVWFHSEGDLEEWRSPGPFEDCQDEQWYRDKKNQERKGKMQG